MENYVSLKSGKDSSEVVGGGKAISATTYVDLGAGESMVLVVGQNKCAISMDQAGAMMIVADQQIVLKGGSASLVIGPSEVKSNPMPVQGTASPSQACLKDMAAAEVVLFGS